MEHHGNCHQEQGSGGATAKDPVCGMNVDPDTAAAFTVHNGVRYHFCSEHCLTKFEADPAAYLRQPPGPSE